MGWKFKNLTGPKDTWEHVLWEEFQIAFYGTILVKFLFYMSLRPHEKLDQVKVLIGNDGLSKNIIDKTQITRQHLWSSPPYSPTDTHFGTERLI